LNEPFSSPECFIPRESIDGEPQLNR